MAPLHSVSAPHRSIGRPIAFALVAFLTFGVGLIAGLYFTIFGSISPIALAGGQSGGLNIPEDLSAGRPVTLLVIGTDDRSGGNADIGGEEEGVRADTTILIHVDADRKHVKMASIPRDLMTDMPSCTSNDGSVSEEGYGQFNTAFSLGYGTQNDMAGALSCVMRTVETSTGIRPDAGIVMDFRAVVGVVDSLGGVQVCGQNEFSPDGVGDFHLPAGCHTLKGLDSVQFLRARYVGNDGSDLARIDRQQCFLRTASRQFLDGDLLSQTSKGLSVANALAQHTHITENLASTPALTGFLYSLKDLAPGALSTVTPPVAEWDGDRNRVVWAEGAEKFWADFDTDHDQLMAQSAGAQSGAAGHSGTPTADGAASGAAQSSSEEDTGEEDPTGQDNADSGASPDASASTETTTQSAGKVTTDSETKYCY
ncbi:MAG: LCP family protein [Actinomycetaceae bacterium]|nr:LCP family protein [Actinomycetaceae bacterium]